MKIPSLRYLFRRLAAVLPDISPWQQANDGGRFPPSSASVPALAIGSRVRRERCLFLNGKIVRFTPRS